MHRDPQRGTGPVKANQPIGIDAIMARMPRRFVEHARKTAERARRLRAAQARHFEVQACQASVAAENEMSEWQDTVMIGGHLDEADSVKT